ncbi:MAG: EAL domain-containing protein [Desulfobulbaceae bacterium]|nr:EAL domain-containing protein [Desulfobulbaceae bacterium]
MGRKLIIATALSGLVWGGAVANLLLKSSISHQAFNLVILSGLSAGAMTVMAADYRVYAGYLLSSLIPPIGTCLFLKNLESLSLATLLAMLLIFLLLAGRRLNSSIVNSLILRYENRDLLKALDEEKVRLGSRLARVLNDLSTEIYIIDLENLAILQSNAGATRNLGYSMAELLRLQLPDINPELNRERFATLLEGWQEENHTQITINGEHRRKNGTSYPIEVRLQISHRENPPVCVLTAIDNSERHLYEERLVRQANYSELTGLPNKKMAFGHIAMAMGRSNRKHYKIALLFLDLDDFKKVNDSLGHAAGDDLLRQLAQRLSDVIRKTDIAAHIGGDEFLVVLEDIREVMDATILAQKIFVAMAQPYIINSREIFLSASIGISIFPDNGDSPEKLLQQADTAMYSAKTNGKNCFQFFNQSMNDALSRQLLIESELRKAIHEHHFEVFFQPLCDGESGQPVTAEALLRWNSEELGPVSPAEFIPVAEHSGLITEIGTWVLESACREAATWPEKTGRLLRLAVNISPRQFRATNLVQTVTQALAISGLPSHLLELEITEGLLLQDQPELQEKLSALRKLGIQFSLDDFGTGYSSLSYLKRFPIQTLKIDRSFINSLENDSNDQFLVSAIVSMGHSLNLQVVAEGVESQGQLRYLREKGVDLIQGYLMSRPLPAQAFRDYLQSTASPAASHK